MPSFVWTVLTAAVTTDGGPAWRFAPPAGEEPHALRTAAAPMATSPPAAQRRLTISAS
jgi:hypothetical protein